MLLYHCRMDELELELSIAHCDQLIDDRRSTNGLTHAWPARTPGKARLRRG
jgi:hypothetical protein